MMAAAYAALCLVAPLAVEPVDRPRCVAAIVDGDPALVSAVKRSLGGDRTRLGSDCDRVRVRLSSRRQDIAVAIEDGYGRRAERTVTSVAAASALIESWATLAGDLRGAGRETAAPAAMADEPDDPPAPQPAVGAVRYHLSVQAESSMDSDRYVWLGARAAACAPVGPLCVGGALRTAGDGTGRGLAPRSTLARTDWEGLVTMAWAVRLRRLVLWPGVAGGVGWMHVRDGGEPGADASDDDRVPRFELSLGFSTDPRSRLAVTGSLALDLTAAALTYSEDGYPVQPRAFLRLGLGVAWRGL